MACASTPFLSACPQENTLPEYALSLTSLVMKLVKRAAPSLDFTWSSSNPACWTPSELRVAGAVRTGSRPSAALSGYIDLRLEVIGCFLLVLRGALSGR